jgi:hypothetical protein
MSDVVVSVVESNTAVTVTEQDVAVDVTENNVVVSVSTAGIQGVPGANNDPTYVTVRNATGATLAKGTIVYISGANGNNVQVSPALATGDSTSARTIGWLAASIPNNGSGLCMVEGYLEGLNTHGFTAGAQLYLSGTVAGAFTATKPVAPTHLVYVGVVTKVSSGDGHVFVKVQNGYELEELHNVQITNPTNAQVLAYDSATQLWKNATNAPDGVTSITAVSPLTGGTITSTGSIGLDQTALSITKSQVSDFTSGTVTSASTAQQAGTAVYSVNSGTAVYATTSGTAVFANTSGTAVSISGDITKSQVSDFTSGTVASASTAQQSGTAVFANTSGTATFATTSGTAVYSTTSGTAVFATNASTAVNLSGSITKSQVSDFASGTVTSASTAQQAGTAVFANTSGTATYATNSGTAVFATNASTAVTISGSITQSQVTNLTTDLANTAKLNTANTFTVGGHVINNGATGTVPIRLNAITGQTANQMEFYNSSGVLSSRIAADGAYVAGANSESFISGASFRLQITPASAATVAATIRGASGQSANLQVWTDNANNVLASVNSAGLLNLTRALTLIQTNAGEYGIRVRGASGQSADLLQLQNSAGTNLLRADQFGGLFSTYAAFTSDSATTLPLRVRGAANQVEDLTEWQNSSATVLGGRNANAQIFTGSVSPIQTAVGAGINGVTGNGTTVTFSTTNAHGLANGDRVTIAGLTPAGYNGTYIISGVSTFSFNVANATTGTATGSGTVSVDAQASITARSAGTIGLQVRGATSQAADLLRFVNAGGTTLSWFNAGGSLFMGGSGTLISAVSGRAAFITNDAAQVPMLIRGAASQSANLLEVQNSASSVVARIDSVGDITARVSRSTFAARYTTTDPSIAIQVNTGAASQTGDFFQTQTSTGTVMQRLTSAGLIRAADNVIANALVGASGSADTTVTTSLVRIQANSTLGGGWLQATRLTSAPGSITADSGQVYFRVGTNPNTLKLVVKAGAGAEQTIIDNIPTT